MQAWDHGRIVIEKHRYWWDDVFNERRRPHKLKLVKDYIYPDSPPYGPYSTLDDLADNLDAVYTCTCKHFRDERPWPASPSPRGPDSDVGSDVSED